MHRRVLRGGSWNNNENNLRVTNRNRNNPQNRNNNIGFRCAQYFAIIFLPEPA
ncbi:SUMF1/EgtB/PvdO family nonheme iron enzyme [candidate division KSB1 bacterium]|nr:SUMF1/EgtB/PvdO family nonheme iron enzyme [candidate division KSB1 bacterium]